MTRTRALYRIGVRLALVGALCGCASFPSMQVNPATSGDLAREAQDAARDAIEGARTPRAAIAIPRLDTGARPSVPEATPEQIAALVPDEPIGASLPPQPLPQFLDTVFREVLKVPYSLGPDIGSRTDIISVNAPPTLSKRAYMRNLQIALRPYGVALSVRGQQILVSEQGGGAGVGQRPQVVRSRSSADTPLAARSVIQFFQLVALQAEPVKTLLDEMTPASIEVDTVSNALIITGPGRSVAQAVEIVRNLDQPAFGIKKGAARLLRNSHFAFAALLLT